MAVKWELNQFELEIGVSQDDLRQIEEYYKLSHGEELAPWLTRLELDREFRTYFLEPERFLSYPGTKEGIDDCDSIACPYKIRFDNLITARLNAYLVGRLIEISRLIPGDLSVEKVHDLRVAIKRIQVVDNYYHSYLNAPMQKMTIKLTRLFKMLGPLRDLDVIIGRVNQPELLAKRGKEAARRKKQIAKKDYPAKLKKLLAKSVLIAPIDNGKGDIANYNFAKTSKIKIMEVQTNVAGYASLFESGKFDLTSYHRLRLVFKEYKYLMEFADLEQLDHYSKVKDITSLLGDIHDCHNMMIYTNTTREQSGLDALLEKFAKKFKDFRFDLG